MATTLFIAFESLVALFAAILVVYAFRSIYRSCFARTPCAILEYWQCGSAMLLLALPQMLLLALFELFSAIALLAVGTPGAASASVKIGLAYVTETAHNFLLPAFLPCFVQVLRLAHFRLPIEPNTFGSRWAPYLLPTSDRAFYVALAISIAMGVVNTAAEVNASPSVEFQAQIGIDFVKFPVEPAWLGSLSTNFGIIAPSLWIVYTGVAIAICFRRYLLCVGGVVVLIGNIALNSFPLGFISISALTELFFQWATCFEVNSFIAEEELVNGPRLARLADEPFPASSQAYNALRRFYLVSAYSPTVAMSLSNLWPHFHRSFGHHLIVCLVFPQSLF